MITLAENPNRMKTVKFEIAFIPVPKQSMRHRIAKNRAGKQYIHSYQTSKIIDNAEWLKIEFQRQKPKDFVIFKEICFVELLEIVYVPPKSWTKKKLRRLQNEIMYKTTIPDLDNLNKQLFDALKGIIIKDDNIIAVHRNIVKKYGLKPSIKIILRGK